MIAFGGATNRSIFACGVLTGLLGAVALALPAWLVWGAAAEVGPVSAAIAPETAVGLVLCGVALVLVACAARRKEIFLCALAVVLVAGWSLLEEALGRDPGIGMAGLLFEPPAPTGRIAVGTSLALLIAGLALAWRETELWRRAQAVGLLLLGLVLASGGSAVAFIALSKRGGLEPESLVVAAAAVGFVALGVGIAFAARDLPTELLGPLDWRSVLPALAVLVVWVPTWSSLEARELERLERYRHWRADLLRETVAEQLSSRVTALERMGERWNGAHALWQADARIYRRDQGWAWIAMTDPRSKAIWIEPGGARDEVTRLGRLRPGEGSRRSTIRDARLATGETVLVVRVPLPDRGAALLGAIPLEALLAPLGERIPPDHALRMHLGSQELLRWSAGRAAEDEDAAITREFALAGARFRLTLYSPRPWSHATSIGAAALSVGIVSALLVAVACQLAFTAIQRRNRLDALHRAERELSRELVRSNSELEQFAYVASHDLQEPLRMVASYMQLLERRYKGKLDDDADKYIHFAVDGAQRMQGLINGLLAYSRAGRGDVPDTPVCASRIFSEVLANLRGAIEESDAEIRVEALPDLRGNPAQLVAIFQNLIGNALKYRSARRPRIRVGLETRAGEPVIAVRDNGIGFDSAQAERIFRPFQRLHERGRYPGTGIGLAIVARIVSRYDGRVWAESQAGVGSTFYVALPLASTQRRLEPRSEGAEERSA